ncbi:MAG: T9SS type A sorting domain-containing protein [Flavobacteriales bacterium]|jgi:hypothetical protein|nr:T9SS type A sorting domain-containing protein [Flavobacteriales bacterium]
MRWLNSIRSLCFGALCLAAAVESSAQTYHPPTGQIYQIKDSMELRFAAMRDTMPDSLFYHEGGEYAEFQKWFRHWEVRAPQGSINTYDQVMQGYVARQAHSNSGFRSNDDPWVELGPKRRTLGMVGIGPIRNIVISDVSVDHMLCTSSSGGLFYTTDGAETWQNAGTDTEWPHSGCAHAAYYPGQTHNWYGVSAYGHERIAYIGGVYRTVNGPGAWEQAPVADYNDLNGPDTQIKKLLFDRKQTANGDHRLFIAADNGLYYSDNPAAPDPSWNYVTMGIPNSITDTFPSATVEPAVRVWDIEYLPYDPLQPTDTLCAAVKFTVHDADTVRAVWRFMLSVDNGDSWNEIQTQPAIDLSVSYATVETSAAAPNAFYCLAAKSNSWVQAYDAPTQVWTPMASGFNTTYGAGHGFGVDQFDANSIFVSHAVGVPGYLKWYYSGISHGLPATGHVDIEDVVGDANTQGVIWVANHGGVSRLAVNATTWSSTWEDKSDGLGVAEVDAMATSQNVPDYIVLGLYHDHSVITHATYEPMNWDPDYAKLAIGGDGTRCLIERSNENAVYASGQIGAWMRDDSASGPSPALNVNYISVPSQWWSEGDLNHERESHLYRATLFNEDTIHYWGNNNGVRFPKTHYNREIEINRSFTKGTSPVVVSDFAHDPKVSHPDLAVDSFNIAVWDNEMFWWVHSNPANPDHLYVSIRNWDWQSRVYRTTQIDNPDVNAVKASWEEVPHPRRVELYTNDSLRQPSLTAVAFDPEDENTIYLAYASSQFLGGYNEPYGNRMVFKMDVSDLGQYPPGDLPFDCPGTPCGDITMNLPNTFIDIGALMAEQGSDGGLYVATEAGVYFTDNKRIAAFDPAQPEDPDDMTNMSGWVKLGGALPHVSSRGIEANYQVNRVRVGLTGRGVWEHHLHCPDTLNFTETGTYGTDRYLEAMQQISSAAVVPTGLDVHYRAGEEIHLTPGFHAQNGSRFHAFIHPCDAPGNSFQPKMIQVPNAPLADMEEVDGQQSIQLFPNPATGAFTILADFIPKKGTATVRVYGPTGNLALSSAMQGPKHRVDANGLHGLYMVVVESADVQKTAKIILQ